MNKITEVLLKILLVIGCVICLMLVLWGILSFLEWFMGYDEAEELCNKYGREYERFVYVGDNSYIECCKMNKQVDGSYMEDCKIYA